MAWWAGRQEDLLWRTLNEFMPKPRKKMYTKIWYRFLMSQLKKDSNS